VDYRILNSAFMSPQPSPLWSTYDLLINIESSAMTSFSFIDLKQSDELEVNYLRFPWGESATIKATGLAQSDKFTLDSKPTTSIIHAPIGLTLTMTFILGAGLWFAFVMVRNRAKYPLMIEMILVPVVFALHFFAIEPLYILGLSSGVVFIWWATAIISPKTGAANGPATAPQIIVENFPTIACPQCQTSNPVTSDLRPIRIQCVGCERVIKIVA
ncbi:MAG: hypothetical protein ACPG83_07835, partial [Candidatus Poseidoniaceae archaeon]